jgi:hypothetical protein
LETTRAASIVGLNNKAVIFIRNGYKGGQTVLMKLKSYPKSAISR